MALGGYGIGDDNNWEGEWSSGSDGIGRGMCGFWGVMVQCSDFIPPHHTHTQEVC